MKNALQAIWRSLQALPPFIRRALQTRTGRTVLMALVLQALRRVPILQSLGTPQAIADWILSLLDAGTAATLAYGTIWANDTLHSMAAGNRPVRQVQSTDAPSLQRLTVAGRVVPVAAWSVDLEGLLVAVLDDGRAIPIPAAQMSVPQRNLLAALVAEA